MDFIKSFSVTHEDGSKVTISGEIPFEELQKHREAALQELGKNIEVDGFRKGHVPEDVLIQRIGEGTLLSEMAERALAEVYPAAIQQHEIDAVGHPQISITKLAPDNPLGFSATVAVMPEITLPDYKALAKEVNESRDSVEITDEDVEKQIKDIMRQRIAYERLQAKAQNNADEGGSKDSSTQDDNTTDLPTPETVEQKDDDTNTEEQPTDPAEIKDEDLPELTDDYVKGLGQSGQFESVDDFKSKLREHLTIEKEKEVTSAHRAKLTDKIVEESQFTVPQVMVDAELNQMFAQMEEDLKKANLSMDDYLSHVKKTKDELKSEWQDAAEKRARLQLVLNEIARQEEITPDEKEVEEQVAQLKEQYKDVEEERVRLYVNSVLKNEAAMKMLESQ